MKIARSRARVSLFVALASALTLMVGPSAFAGHHVAPKYHEDAPTPPVPRTKVVATCDVDGSVALTPAPGLNLTPSHLHYTFTSTTLECTDRYGETWGGNYTVSADGGTDGPLQWDPSAPGTLVHGETCAVGWSNSDGYSGGRGGANVNKGDIGATHVHAGGNHVSASGSPNWVKFVREGEAVTAWGELTFTATAHGGVGGVGTVTKFYAELVFSPDPNESCTDGVEAATLSGTAVVYR